MSIDPTKVIAPGLDNVPVAESAISFIDGKRARLEYRGIAVETLAKESCFEETAWLLLKGDLPSQKELADFDDLLRHRRRIKYKLVDLIKTLPETGHPMGALQSAVAAMSMFYPAREVTNPKVCWESVIRLIANRPSGSFAGTVGASSGHHATIGVSGSRKGMTTLCS